MVLLGNTYRVCLFMVPLCPAVALAQAGPPAPPRSQSIPVVLHDKHGKPLGEVKKEDLQLQVDSKPAVIANLESTSAKPLLLGLIVDTSKPQEQVVQVEKAPEKTFLDGYLDKASNQTFVIHYDRQIEMMQDLTADRTQVNSAVDDLQPASAVDESDTTNRDDDDARQRKRYAGERLYDAIFLAADEILNKPGARKALVVVGSGIDHDSKESFASAVEAAQRRGVAVYTVYVAGEQEPELKGLRSGDEDGQQGRRNGGNWPGSPGGGWPGGGQTGGGQSGGGQGQGGHSKRSSLPHEDGRKILLELSQKTGGAMFEAKKKEELAGLLSQITQYLQDEYLLTFQVDAQSSGDFHRIGLTSREGPVQAPQAFYTGH